MVLPSALPRSGLLHGIHDLERILAHYEDDFEMSSPIITTLVGEPSGKLRGKMAVGAYWAKALQSIPNLRFELLAALAGVNSITSIIEATEDWQPKCYTSVRAAK
jgi:SnoaL-like domain